MKTILKVSKSTLILIALSFVFICPNLGHAQEFYFKKEDLSDIVKNVTSASQSIEEWTQSLNQIDFNFLCLGEVHEDFYRSFYSNILSQLSFKNLALEATQEEYTKLQEMWQATQSVKYLNADYTPIIQYINLNKNLKVLPVESTKKQDLLAFQDFSKTQKQTLYRDGFITENILSMADPNEKIVAVYGDNHCSTTNTGLGNTPFMNHLKNHFGSSKALSVTLLKRGGSKPHPLVAYLDSSDEHRKKVRVIKSEKLPAEVHNFNWEIMTLTLNFDYIIIY
jgi:hypothetical protein